VPAVDHEPVDHRLTRLVVRRARVVHQEADQAFASVDRARAGIAIEPRLGQRLGVACDQVLLRGIELEGGHGLAVLGRHVLEFDLIRHALESCAPYSAAMR
jgi:hypothetical protein